MSVEEDLNYSFPFEWKNDQNHISKKNKYDPNKKSNNIYKPKLLSNIRFNIPNHKQNTLYIGGLNFLNKFYTHNKTNQSQR